jgi:amino acid transporter
MPEQWYKGLPASGVAVLFLIGMYGWKSDTASGIERAWVSVMAISTAFGFWGLARALQTRGWVNDEQHRHPNLDYVGALSVAQTHTVTHACTLITTVALLVFGIVVAFSLPTHPNDPPARNAYILGACMITVGMVKTFLNIYLVYKREKLVKIVQEIGGD